jgi:hypothetical protein
MTCNESRVCIDKIESTYSGGGLILFTLVSAPLVFPMIWQWGHSCPSAFHLRCAPVAAVSPIVASTTTRKEGGLNFSARGGERQKHEVL